MLWVFLRICGREFHRDYFAQGKGEESHNGRTVLVSQDKRSGNAFIAMLSCGGFEKSIKLGHSAVKTGAVMML